MPTTDVIEYDLAVLDEMTQKQLTLQQIYRQDLFFPKRSTNLKASEFAADQLEKIQALCDSIPAIFPEIKASLQESIDAYKEVIA